ncbi:hypothetical protein [Bifidobacterium pseudolongum]|uniref:hypothetical protein n=1 Tax=Bifidobacterium pseudolongum TaxID=1694 RepID=UPI001178BF73|nr:hypothetical protein [Bifidobacterium pseudolongum]
MDKISGNPHGYPQNVDNSRFCGYTNPQGGIPMVFRPPPKCSGPLHWHRAPPFSLFLSLFSLFLSLFCWIHDKNGENRDRNSESGALRDRR